MNSDANMDSIEVIHTTDEELARDERVAVDFSLTRRPEDVELAKTRVSALTLVSVLQFAQAAYIHGIPSIKHFQVRYLRNSNKYVVVGPQMVLNLLRGANVSVRISAKDAGTTHAVAFDLKVTNHEADERTTSDMRTTSDADLWFNVVPPAGCTLKIGDIKESIKVDLSYASAQIVRFGPIRNEAGQPRGIYNCVFEAMDGYVLDRAGLFSRFKNGFATLPDNKVARIKFQPHIAKVMGICELCIRDRSYCHCYIGRSGGSSSRGITKQRRNAESTSLSAALSAHLARLA